MKTAENITVTDGRLKKALTTQIEPIVMPKVSKQINKAVNSAKFQMGIMTKFYPYLDKCEVNVGGKLILCKILHRFMGDLIDFYTPSGTQDFCDTLKEPCILPRSELNCLILDVNDKSNEQIMVGYINSEELLGINPAEMGNIKIVNRAATNQFWIKFGISGLDIRSSEVPITNVGERDSEMAEVNYANSNDTYSKFEIDKMLSDLKNELSGGKDNGTGN